MSELEKYLPDKSAFPPSQYWEVHLEKGFTTGIILKNGDIEQITENDTSRGNVRMLIDGGWGFSTFNKLEDAKANVQSAADYARSIGGSDSRVASQPPVQMDIATPCQKHPDSISLADKLALAQGYHARLKDHPHADLVEVRLGDITRNSLFLNAEGSLISRQEVLVYGMLIITGMVDGVPETYYASFRHRIGYEGFDFLDGLVPKLLHDFDELLRAEQAKGGVYDCILDPMLTGVFAHEAFGHTSEADFFSRNPQLAEVMKIGKMLGNDVLSIFDDSTIEPLSGGSIAVDDEGVAGRRTTLLDKGIIAGHLHNRETAALLGEEVSGNARAINAGFPPIVRMTNTFVGAGTATEEELLRELGNGIMVVGSRGGMGGEDFTFSAMHGYMVEDGKLAQPIKNFTLSGNLFATLKNIVACSNEVKMFSSAGGCGKSGQIPLPVGLGGPHVLLKKALIGGR
jgi:TldD protein